MRTAEVTAPGFKSDLFSAFYPLSVVSPALQALRLEQHGLRWVAAPRALVHPTFEGPAVVIDPDIGVTAARSSASPRPAMAMPGVRCSPPSTGSHRRCSTRLLTPFPPVRSAVRLAALAGPRGLVDIAELGFGSVRSQSRKRFAGEGGALLLGGNALHTDLMPSSASSAIYGWLLASLAQQVGWPVPEGGAGQLTAALVRRLEARGGRIECGTEVTKIVVRGGRAVGVRTRSGNEMSVARAVVADVGAPALYLDLLDAADVPARVRREIRKFRYGDGTFKMDYGPALTDPLVGSGPSYGRNGPCRKLARSSSHVPHGSCRTASCHAIPSCS